MRTAAASLVCMIVGLSLIDEGRSANPSHITTLGEALLVIAAVLGFTAIGIAIADRDATVQRRALGIVLSIPGIVVPAGLALVVALYSGIT